jgi:hypothetical protein
VHHNDKKGDINLPATIRSLDKFYIITKLEYCCNFFMRSASTQLSVQESFFLLEEVLETARSHYFNEPVIQALYYSIQLLRHNDNHAQEYYQQLKIVLDSFSESFSPRLLETLHSYMRKYIANRYNHGDNACLPELFDLFKNHIRLGTVYKDGRFILASALQNIVAVAVRLGEHEWATNFLREHKDRIIGADDVESIYQFNLATCYFHRGDFKTAERHLANHQFREVYYKLAARRLEIKLYYETKSVLLDARLDAFKVFVHELKSLLPPDMIEPNNHFADLMRQILTPKTLGNRNRINKLIKKMEIQKAVAEREWLLQKLNLLLEHA